MIAFYLQCKRLANAVMPPPARLPLLIVDCTGIGSLASSSGDATVRWLVDLALDVVAQLPPPTRVHIDFEREDANDAGVVEAQSFADDDDSVAAQRQRLRREFPSFVRRVCQVDDDDSRKKKIKTFMRIFKY